MAFTNLFSSLSAVGEAVRRPGEPAWTRRSQGENGKRSLSGKSEPQAEHRGPYEKKGRYQEPKKDAYNPTRCEYSDLKATHFLHASSEHASFNFTTEGIHDHNDKHGHTGLFHKGRHRTAENNRRVNKQRQERQKTRGGQKNHVDKWRNTNTGGGQQERQNSRKYGEDRKHNYGRQDVHTKLPRVMTQEFKDQNALLLDGRLLCRHYLRGRCVKGDDCQLEHIQGCNDLIKEVCKFYIQGFCARGESCSYMHKSFPCKFFHRKGKCSHGADCRFSHEPLNELTNRLLDEAMKRENELYKLSKEAEQDSSGQPAKTDESEITDANMISDIPTQPQRPNFYNSEQTQAEQESLLCPAEELSVDGEEPYSHQTRPNGPPSVEPVQEGPVCYSVEAVLGRQHFKPFPTFTTASRGQQTASKSSLGSVSKSEVPYSVDTFLRSCKRAENFTLGHTPTPPAARAASYTSKTDSEDVTAALLRSQVEDKNVLCPVSTRDQTSKSQEKLIKTVSSQKVQPFLTSEACSDSTRVSGGNRKQGVEIPDSPKPVQSVSHEVRLEILHSSILVGEKGSKRTKRDSKESTCFPADITCSVNTRSESVVTSALNKSKSLTCTPKHPARLKPHPSSLTWKPQASVEPICPTGSSNLNKRVAVSAEPVTNPEKVAGSGNSISRSALCTRKLDKASARSFLSLFAAPLLPAPTLSQSQLHDSGSTSCSQEPSQSVNAVSHLKDSEQRASHSETPFQYQVRNGGGQTSHRPSSPKLSTSPKNENAECVNLHEEQQAHTAYAPPDSVCEISISPASCGNITDPSETQSHPTQLGMSSHKAATADSVLKTLFLCLGPYRQDREQQDSIHISVPSETGKDKSSTECVFVKTPQKNKREARGNMKTKTKDDHQPCSEKPDAHSVKHQTSVQTPQISLESTCGSPLGSLAVAEPWVRRSAKHNLPLKAVTQPVQHRSRLKLTHTLEEGRCANGNTVVTPLKDLFKSFDTSVFHFGN